MAKKKKSRKLRRKKVSNRKKSSAKGKKRPKRKCARKRRNPGKKTRKERLARLEGSRLRRLKKNKVKVKFALRSDGAKIPFCAECNTRLVLKGRYQELHCPKCVTPYVRKKKNKKKRT